MLVLQPSTKLNSVENSSPKLPSGAIEALDRRATEVGQQVRDPSAWAIKRMTVKEI